MNPFKFILAALRQAGVFGLYMDSGGSSTPSETTQKTDLPDWAKPYAQETLEKTKQLSSAPYQSYNAPRIAGFSPMQEQSFAGAQQLGPSQMGMFGGQLAGAASLGALGTTYNPFRMGQFTSGRAAQYMNPFVEQAMEPQLREAARASEMQRNQEQAKAVGAGAFGGSRQAIVEAERQRNLGQLQGDIRAKGYMSAFDQAQQNFAREQQLREQSRQYGANLGMQGLQTALQGAGQLGALGGQQFGQQKEAIGLQNQLGAQQQALRQQGLTQSYQDFLNEQNYPYRQLGFMSDMIRGLPLGQQSTSQVYQAPGSMAGQLAGLGVGLAGMSRAGLFAEGGEVQEYADGGDVTSDYNVNDIISKLSDVQLQQARAAALNSGDRQRLEMIDGELAQRASLRSGLGGAFDALPQETQDAVTEMANGGIVAFADGGTMSGFETTPEQMAQDELRRQSLLGRQAEESRYSALAEGRTPPVAPPAAAPAAAAVPAQQTPQPPRAAPQAARAPSASAGTSITRKEAASAVQTITEAARVQLPKDETRELTSSLFKEFMSKSDPERAEFKAELKTLKDRAKQIEAEGIGRAMMKFGFGMAASAAKPGVARREGLAGALESAAAAAPVFAESLDETAKLKQAAQDNYMKLRMDNARYESALEQGNMQLASSIANNISQRQLVQADLQQKMVQNERMFGLEKEKLGIMRSQASQPTAIQKIAGELRAANPSLGVEDALQRASQIAGYSFRSEGAAGGKLAAALTKIDDDYKMLPALMASNPNAPFVQVMAADQKRRRDEAYRLYGAQQPAGVASTAGAGWSIEPVSGGK